jgi:hypothetical protein
VQAYSDSDVAASVLGEVARLRATGGAVLPESGGRVRASWMTQFRILSGRAFKNLYRDPALLAAHYLSSVGVAREFLFVTRLTPRTKPDHFSDLCAILPWCYERYSGIPESAW